MVIERPYGVKGAPQGPVGRLACTRDAQDRSASVEAWHRLRDDAFARLWWTPDESITVEFELATAHDVRRRLTELVRAERRCCGFLHWQVRRRGPYVRLRVTGPGAHDTVAALLC